MTNSFNELLKKSLNKIQINIGSIIQGTVLDIKKNTVLVDSGLKSESLIPIEQFINAKNELEIKIGDTVDLVLEALEDGYGETLLSREKAKKYEAWNELENAFNNSNSIKAIISSRVKGGFTVDFNGIKAFLPGSLVDIKPIQETTNLEGKEFEFKVIKLDQKRNNIVLSRKAIIENENNLERNKLLKQIKENQNIFGFVKNITDYGAFIDLGGIDGLLHITDISWGRIKHPSEVLKIGDKINVKILKFDEEKSRVSLGLKQLKKDPWIEISKKYPEKSKLRGKVTNITDYGCFIEIENGIEGLIHISEMDWIKKNIHPNKIVSIGEEIEAMVLDIDQERRRISLGRKQCRKNPWKVFSEKHQKNDVIKGEIKSITDFGIFIKLEGGVDGLVHLSDISWVSSGESEIKKYKEGDEIDIKILQIDIERERISLGIKQLSEDPLNIFHSKNKKGSLIKGKIISIKDKNEEKKIFLKLNSKVNGVLKFKKENQLSKTEQNNLLKIGNLITTKYDGIDKKNRIVLLTGILNEKKLEENSKKNEKKDKNSKISNKIMIEAFKAAKNE